MVRRASRFSRFLYTPLFRSHGMSQGVEARSRPTRSRAGKVNMLAVPSNVRLRVSDEDFWRLCQENPELRLERTEKGVVEIMPPTSGGTGARNADLTAQLVNW